MVRTNQINTKRSQQEADLLVKSDGSRDLLDPIRLYGIRDTVHFFGRTVRVLQNLSQTFDRTFTKALTYLQQAFQHRSPLETNSHFDVLVPTRHYGAQDAARMILPVGRAAQKITALSISFFTRAYTHVQNANNQILIDSHLVDPVHAYGLQEIARLLRPMVSVLQKMYKISVPLFNRACVKLQQAFMQYRARFKILHATQDPEISVIALRSFGAGMENGGNSCYIASVLQGFRFSSKFKTTLDEAATQKNHEIAIAIKNIFAIIEGTTNQAPRNLSNAEINNFRTLCMKNGWKPRGEHTQEDAAEFLRFLLDNLKFPVFPYKVEKKHQCPITCRIPAFDPVEPQKNNHIVIKLGEAKDYTELSRLVGGADVFEEVRKADIPDCPDDMPASLSLLTQQSISLFDKSVPAFAPVSLARHRFNRDSLEEEKDTTKIVPSFELEIPIHGHSGRKAHFTLKSIVVHEGPSAHSGHYRTYVPVKTNSGRCYICFDDSTTGVVCSREAESNIRRGAYLYNYDLTT